MLAQINWLQQQKTINGKIYDQQMVVENNNFDFRCIVYDIGLKPMLLKLLSI